MTASGLYQEDLARVHAEGFGAHAEAAAAAIVERLQRSDPAVTAVFDVGCGAGVTTCALLAAGLHVVACDASPALLAIAARAAPRARFVLGSAYEVEVPPCEAVIAVGEVLGYHRPEDDADARVRAFFSAVAHALPAGGHFVFDVIVAEGPPLDARGFRAEREWVVLSETVEDRAARTLERRIEVFRRDQGELYRRTREVHHVRLFEERALVAWLGAEGFAVETAAAYGELPLLPRRRAFFARRA